MKREMMIQAMDLLDEKFIAEADPANAKNIRSKKIRSTILRYGSIAACVCLILVGMVMMRIYDHVERDILININRIDGSFDDFSAYIDIDATMFTGLPKEEYEAAIKDFEMHTRLDYAALEKNVPNDMVVSYFLATFTPPKVYGSSERMLHDYVLEYKTKNGGRVSIAMCSSGKPMRCVILPESVYEKSYIDETEIMIYASGNESIGYNYIAEFSWKGVNYLIQGNDISEVLLQELLCSLIK